MATAPNTPEERLAAFTRELEGLCVKHSITTHMVLCHIHPDQIMNVEYLEDIGSEGIYLKGFELGVDSGAVSY